MTTDHVQVKRLAVQCVVGVRPEERDVEQAVHVDVTLELDLREAGRSSRIADTVDYDRATTQIATLLRFRRYWLIENAAEEVAAMLLGVYPRLEAVRLRIAKPAALRGRADQAAVEIRRIRADYEVGHEKTAWGDVSILLETREAGLYLLNVDAGRQIPRHHHQVMRELEWLVSGELRRADGSIVDSEPVTWAKGAAHSYRNESKERATLFCCDCPPFIPADEIEVKA